MESWSGDLAALRCQRFETTFSAAAAGPLATGAGNFAAWPDRRSPGENTD